MKKLFDQISHRTAKQVTRSYSTSFSLGIYLLDASVREQIYAIYGFVRFADEIVDSFEGYAQEQMLLEFIDDYEKSLEREISINPILNAFQEVVRKYELHALVKQFLNSMKMDLNINGYEDNRDYENYIYGSAEVVGLMCLRVFVDNNEKEYQRLKPYAVKLGAAFQKVNFLRDIRDDLNRLGRSYFPGVGQRLTAESKVEILKDIKSDFDEAFIGIKQLPMNVRFGVYIAYKYYLQLYHNLNNISHQQIMSQRIRVSNFKKLLILQNCSVRYYLKLW